MLEFILFGLAFGLVLFVVFEKKETIEDEIKRNFTKNYWGIKDDD